MTSKHCVYVLQVIEVRACEEFPEKFEHHLDVSIDTGDLQDSCVMWSKLFIIIRMYSVNRVVGELEVRRVEVEFLSEDIVFRRSRTDLREERREKL